MFGMTSNDIGIDLGTASILVYIKGKGVVLKEPSVVAIERDSGRILAIGEEARLMIGRTPGNIIAIRPLRHGVISDYTVTEKMLKYFINKAVGKKTLLRPRIAVCIPSGATEVERKAVEDATINAGAREVFIIEEPVAAAIGAGIDIAKPCGNMIVDIGGGTTDIAVISLGGPVVSTSIKVAGDDFDEALVRYMRKKHNLLIGERTGEDIKIQIGAAYRRPEVLTMEVRGRNLVTGLPKTIVVSSDETLEALQEPALQIVDAGAHSPGAGGGHLRPRHRLHGRRLPPVRTGPALPGEDRHQHYDRGSAADGGRDRNRKIHRVPERGSRGQKAGFLIPGRQRAGSTE